MKKLLVSAVLVMCLLFLVGVIINLLVDREKMTARVQDEMQDVLGLEVDFEQPLRFSLWRGPLVRAGTVTLTTGSEAVASVERALVRLRIMPLLRGDIQVQTVLLDAPELRIERIGGGEFKPGFTGRGEGSVQPLSIPRLRVRDAVVRFHGRPGDREWLFQQCALQLDDIQHAGGEQSDWLASLAMQGSLTCEQIEQGRLQATDVAIDVAGSEGQLAFKLLTGTAFDGQLNARLDLDLASELPQYTLQAGLDDFSLDEFVTALDEGQEASGRMILNLELEGEGDDWLQLRQSAAGKLSLEATGLVLYGVDLDEELDSYAATQRFNLVDVGAVFLAGPLGLAASRGYSFTGMLQTSGEQTPIAEMSSEWTIAQGRAKAEDVAMRTEKSRVALTGELDFINYAFVDLRVAVIDVDGCAMIEQRIDGSFRNPEVASPNVLVEAMGPVLDLLERGLSALNADGECEAFYAGNITHP